MIANFAALLLAATQPAPAAAPCTAETAHRTTVQKIGEHRERWTGRCVTVAGVMTSVAMYDSVEGLYEAHRLRQDGNQDPAALRRHRIGLYSPNNEIRGFRANADGLPTIRVTGTVDTCEQMAAAARAASPNAIVMMSGYCHYYGGAVVRAAVFDIDASRPHLRLIGEAARRRVGNLVFAPVSWPQLAELRNIGERFRAAIPAGDRAGLMQLHAFGDASNEHEQRLLGAMLDDPASVFAQLRTDRDRPMAIFVDRHEAERLRAGILPEQPFGTICFCRTSDCTGRWPISSSDADNAPRRPYACTRTGYVDWAARRIGPDTPLSRGGWLGEPPETAFRR